MKYGNKILLSISKMNEVWNPQLLKVKNRYKVDFTWLKCMNKLGNNFKG